jgi:hypothetical protein
MQRAVVLAIALITACTSVTPVVGPTPSPTPDSVSLARDLFARRAAAIQTSDFAAFQSTYDTRPPTFARCQKELYDLHDFRTYTVQRVDMWRGYYRIIATGSFGASRFFARLVDGALQLTEPQPSEVGESRTRSAGPIVVNYWAIDDEIGEGMTIAAKRAYDFALGQAPTTPPVPFTVTLLPTRLFMTGQCWVAGAAGITNPAAPVISVPTYLATFDGAFAIPSPTTQAVLTHEALHWLQGQIAYGATTSAPWWMTEGWPDRVAGIDRGGTLRVLCSVGFPSAAALFRHGVDLLDQPETIDAEKQYAAANSMVDFLFATYGKDRYWELFSSAITFIDNERAFASVLDTTQAKFYDAWLAWVKRRYC